MGALIFLLTIVFSGIRPPTHGSRPLFVPTKTFSKSRPPPKYDSFFLLFLASTQRRDHSLPLVIYGGGLFLKYFVGGNNFLEISRVFKIPIRMVKKSWQSRSMEKSKTSLRNHAEKKTNRLFKSKKGNWSRNQSKVIK